MKNKIYIQIGSKLNIITSHKIHGIVQTYP